MNMHRSMPPYENKTQAHAPALRSWKTGEGIYSTTRLPNARARVGKKPPSTLSTLLLTPLLLLLLLLLLPLLLPPLLLPLLLLLLLLPAYRARSWRQARRRRKAGACWGMEGRRPVTTAWTAWM
jgi:Flp pilus assembly protein TadB